MTDDPEAPYGRRKDGTPRKPSAVQLRNEARGYVSKGAGMGEGWGGPANGAGNTKPFEEANIAPLMRRANPDAYRARLADKERLREDAMAVYIEVMETSDAEPMRLSAATHLLNRIEGTPMQRVITADAAATLEALILASMNDDGVIEGESRLVERG